MESPLDARTVRAACTRWLSGHGPRTPLKYVRQMLDALGEDDASDFYGSGSILEELEAQVAEMLGKPAALFMPSGTMAQQIALRIWCDEAGTPRVGYHPSSHLHLHEQQALVEVHRLEVALLGEAVRPLCAADVQAVEGELGAVLIELAQRELGGVLPEWPALVELVAAARDKGAAVHMDGARLWETTPFYGKPLAEIAALFDSVYVSFYKGIGGVAGAALAGSQEHIDEARIWQRRHGGNVISLWPYAVTARHGLAERLERMPTYVEHMRAFADAMRELPGVTITPDPPHTNMAHVHLPGSGEALSRAVLEVSQRSGVWLGHPLAEDGRWEMAVGDASLEIEPSELATLVEEVVRRARAGA